MTQQNKEFIRDHYKRFLKSKLYLHMDFAEYIAEKVDIPEHKIYQAIKEVRHLIAT